MLDFEAARCGEQGAGVIHGVQRETQGSHFSADTKILHDTPLTRNVDRAWNVDREVDEADLEGDEGFPSTRPVLRVLQHTSVICQHNHRHATYFGVV